MYIDISEVYHQVFFTSECAIVGGVVTLMGMADQYIFSSKHKGRELAR
jgi:hypothetical protein